MSFAEKNRAFIEKLQNFPAKKKKIILWTTVAVLAVVMGFFWVKGAINSLSNISGAVQNIKIPQINTATTPNIDLQKMQDKINKELISNTPNNK